MRLPKNIQVARQKSLEKSLKGNKDRTLREFWTALFGFKKGDIVRPKYGKCYWEVYSVCPDGWDMIKVRRLRRDKNGSFIPEEVITTLWTWEIVEVQSKEIVEDTFPSQVFR